MGLYAVPQTADVAEPAMAAAVARFKLRAPKPDAIIGNGNGAALSDGTIALHLEGAYDLARSALGDRMTEGTVLVQVDASIDGAVMKIAAMTLYRERGFNRQAGADSSIEVNGAEGMAFLERCRPGANGKQENPRFTTSDNVTSADAPYFTSALGGPGGSARADSFVEARALLTGGCGEVQ